MNRSGVATEHNGFISFPRIVAPFIPGILACLKIPWSDEAIYALGGTGRGGKEDVGDAEAT